MAGVQFLCRKFVFSNTSRLINKNKIFLQPCRKKHEMLFQISTMRKFLFQESKLIAVNHRSMKFRLASTNAIRIEEAAANVVNSSSFESKNKPDEQAAIPNETISFDDSSLPPIPTSAPTDMPQMDFVSMGLTEPSFSSLGLGSWWPSGWIQNLLEFLHISCNLPWWEAIFIVTIIARLIVIPANIKSRKQSYKMNEYLPQIAEIQEKIQKAKLYGDYFTVGAETQKMVTLIQKNGLDLFATIKPLFFQAPIFLSMYYAFRGMVKVPVESLKTQGLFWFTDLTAPDPYYILPGILAVSQFAMIALGAEGGSPAMMSKTAKLFLKVIPVVVFLIATRFSACITFYWVISNLFALLVLQLWSVGFIRRLVGMPELKPIPKVNFNKPSKGIIANIKEGFRDAKIINELKERERANHIAFQKAGSSPIPRTFKTNPLEAKAKKAS